MKKYLPAVFVACCVQLASTPPIEARPLSEKVKIAQAKPAMLNLNTANSRELQTLPGIGAKKALAIVDFREKNGKFAAIDDLSKVKGVGTKMLVKWKGLVEVK